MAISSLMVFGAAWFFPSFNPSLKGEDRSALENLLGCKLAQIGGEVKSSVIISIVEILRLLMIGFPTSKII